VLITVIGYFAAVNTSVRPVAYIVAGVVIAASIVAGIRAWVLDRRSRRREAEEAAQGGR
jgi:membrane-associated protein